MKIEASPPEAAAVMSNQANEIVALAGMVQSALRDGNAREAYKSFPGLRDRVMALFGNLEAYLDETATS